MTTKPNLNSFSKRMLGIISENKFSFFWAVLLLFIVVFSIIIPLISRYNYFEYDLNNTFLPPFSKGHIFGTDESGRDFLTRVWIGVRISITIGFCAALLQSLIGIVYGGLSGMLGGIFDEILMRIADIIYSIPYLVTVILLTLVLGNSELTLIFVLAVSDWTGMARNVRMQTLRLKEMEFVHSSRALGGSNLRIFFKHILPNSLGPIMVNMTFSIPTAIFSEGFLSFIGLGIKIPKASLGSLANDGYNYIYSYPWLLIIPLVFIAASMITFNIVGDALKDSFDSRLR